MKAALAAIVQLDGGPVETPRLEKLADRARLPIPSTRRLAIDGAAGLVELRLFDSDREAADVTRLDGCSIVFDGTLDNRPELTHELRSVLRSDVVSSSALLALAAYLEWGDEFAGRLIGQFALVVWDSRRRRLLAARDPFGVRNLFYRHQGETLYVGSQLCQLHVDGTPGLDELDEEYAAQYLAVRSVYGPETPFRGIRRLLAGHLLVAESGSFRSARYWDFPRDQILRYPSAMDYVERFAELFDDAVGRYLKSGGKVWAELSGGLDSSAIVCVAQELMQKDPSLDRGDFATVTMGWDDTPICDERKWSSTVVEKYGLVCHELLCDDLFLDGAAESARYRDEPHHGLVGAPMLKQESDLLAGAGVEVVLSGARAEAPLLPERPAPIHLSDYLRAFRLRTLYRELLAWQKEMLLPLSNIFLLHALGPLLDSRRIDRWSFERERRYPTFLNEEFARRWNMKDRVRLSREPGGFKSPSKEFQYQLIRGSEQFVPRGLMEWTTELRYPFLHRPLVEFAMATPWEYLVRPGIHKWILRRALKDVLPDLIRLRLDKLGPGASFYKSVPRRWPYIESLIDGSILAELGFVDRQGFREAAEMAKHGSSKNFVAFGGTLSFEIWLRANVSESDLPPLGAC